MMKIFRILLAVIILTAPASFTQKKQVKSDEVIKIQNLEANLRVLASDEFEGREASTRGDRLSQLFIASELQKYGVKAMDEYPDYRMMIELKISRVGKSSTLLYTKGAVEGGPQLHFGEEVASYTRYRTDTSFALPVVFAGYGLSIPEMNYDDFKELDLSGKLVIIAPGVPKQLNPENDPSVQEELTAAKIFGAYRKGAAAVMLVTDDEAEESWSDIARPSITLASKTSTRNPGRGLFFLKQSGYIKLMAASGKNGEEILKEAKAGGTVVPFDPGAAVNLNIKVSNETGYTSNIIGYIEGNDPVLKNEFVAIGAHYDHLGIEGTKVFNGADDDGSGIVSILEISRALAANPDFKRSILIVFHGAEEKGLLGSSYLADNFPRMGDITAQLNIDMVGREHPDTIYSVGSAKITGEMKKLVEEVNAQTVKFNLNYRFDEPNDPFRLYERSDHYNYAKKGIPIVFFYDFMNEDYHKPTDDIEKINFEKIKKVSELMYHLAVKLANLPKRLTAETGRND